MLDKEDKVAIRIVKEKLNQKHHIVAPPQCQVERHMSKKEEEYKLVDFRSRREPIPWTEARRTEGKTASAPIMAKSTIKIHFNGTKSNQPRRKFAT